MFRVGPSSMVALVLLAGCLAEPATPVLDGPALSPFIRLGAGDEWNTTIRLHNEVVMMDLEFSEGPLLGRVSFEFDGFLGDPDVTHRWFKFVAGSHTDPSIAHGGVYQPNLGKPAVHVEAGGTAVGAGPPVAEIVFGTPIGRDLWTFELPPGHYHMAFGTGGLDLTFDLAFTGPDGLSFDPTRTPVDPAVIRVLPIGSGEWDDNTEIWATLGGAYVAHHSLEIGGPLNWFGLFGKESAEYRSIRAPDGDECSNISDLPHTAFGKTYYWGGVPGRYELEAAGVAPSIAIGGPIMIAVVTDLPGHLDATPDRFCL